MSEDLTRRLPDFEARVIAAITDLRAEMRERFASVENEIAVTRRELDARMVAVEGRVAAIEGRMTAVEGRMAALEEQNDARARETTPLWRDIKETLDEISSQMRIIALDSLKMRARVQDLEDKVRQRPPAA